MKVMLSQPMNGVPDSEVRKIQDDLKEKFAKYNIEVIDSFLTEVPDTEIRNPRLFYLGRTIQNFLSDVDAVYFCTGWEKAKGCRIERHICEEYGIPVLDDSFFKKMLLCKWCSRILISSQIFKYIVTKEKENLKWK